METKFLKAALFAGMTANAFKLGTVLSLGWFWMRIAGCYTVYRGQDGNVDDDNVQAVMELGDEQVSIANQNLPAGTSWHYIRRRVSDCGLESDDSPGCVVGVDSAGDMTGDRPNQPFSLTIEKLSNARFRLRWRYSQLNEETRPTGFKVYMDSGSGFDFNSPVATVSYKLGGGMEFNWVSDPLTDGQEYRFCVRSFAGLGPELIENGGFDSDTAWTKGAGWLLSSGKACWQESVGSGMLQQEVLVITGETYRVTFTLQGIESNGKVRVQIGGTDGTLRTANGTYTEELVAIAAQGIKFTPQGQGPPNWSYLEIDNVSVREVTAEEAESQNTNFVAAVADSQGPDAITGLRAEWEEL